MKPNIAERIAEIRKMLAAATPGPWKLYEDKVTDWFSERKIGTEHDHPQLRAPYPILTIAYRLDGSYLHITKENAELIAKAPETTEFLIGEVERQAEEIGNARSLRDFAVKKANELSKLLDNANNAIETLNAELDFERAENERLQRALDTAKQQLKAHFPGYKSIKAYQTLEALKEGE